MNLKISNILEIYYFVILQLTLIQKTVSISDSFIDLNIFVIVNTINTITQKNSINIRSIY